MDSEITLSWVESTKKIGVISKGEIEETKVFIGGKSTTTYWTTNGSKQGTNSCCRTTTKTSNWWS